MNYKEVKHGVLYLEKKTLLFQIIATLIIIHMLILEIFTNLNLYLKIHLIKIFF